MTVASRKSRISLRHIFCFFCTVPGIRIYICALWLLVVGAGFGIISKYQNTAGAAAPAPVQWPATTTAVLDPHRDTLVMFAHPRCPCTRASVEELNRMLARSADRVVTQVWFFKPKGGTGWDDTSLMRDAARIPGVAVHADLDGEQARLFGAETSGYVLLYNPAGKLLFKGGITGSRGHAGDNSGEDSVVSLLSGRPALLAETPVYGCSLFGDCLSATNTNSK
jgi:hypothetical protein